MRHILLICGDHRQSTYVHQLSLLLRDNGIPVWLDDPTATADGRPDALPQQIEACAAIVVVMTPAAEASERVGWVVRHAIARPAPIIPLLLEGAPYGRLAHLPVTDVRGPVLPGAELVGRLRQFVSAAELPEPAPPPAGSASGRWPSGLPAVLAGVVIAWVMLGVLAVILVRPWDFSRTTGSGGSTTQVDPRVTGPAARTCAGGRLAGQGSATQVEAMNRWIEAYRADCPSADVNYQGTGSGAGLQAFTTATADFVGTDSVLTGTEQAAADSRCGAGRAINLPMLVSPIAVVFELPGVTRLDLSPLVIAKIFSGQVTRWNDPTIVADNPGAALGDTPIVAIHHSDASWTTNTFTGFLEAAAASGWAFGHDEAWRAPGGSGQRGSEQVSAFTRATAGSVGYLPWSVAQRSSLPTARIRTASGAAVPLTAQTAASTILAATIAGTGSDLKLAINQTASAGNAYPIVDVAYDIVCERGNPADRLARLRSFLGFAVGPGQDSLSGLGYAPLPSPLRLRIGQALNALS